MRGWKPKNVYENTTPEINNKEGGKKENRKKLITI